MHAASIPDHPSDVAYATIDELRAALARFPAATLVDVRRDAAFERDPVVLPGAIRRRPEDVATWSPRLESWRPVVVYCVHGHEVSRGAATALRALGFDARPLAGGLEGWRESGGALVPFTPPTRWVTRARPKVDRIACPWLLRRFIDPDAQIDYVPAADVLAHAARTGAVPFDVPDVAYSHDGERCSFDAFIRLHGLADPALDRLAAIVRGADTGALALAPEAAGLLAVSLGLSRAIDDDDTMLRHGLLVYDALYARCRDASGETHDWRPDRLRAGA